MFKKIIIYVWKIMTKLTDDGTMLMVLKIALSIIASQPSQHKLFEAEWDFFHKKTNEGWYYES